LSNSIRISIGLAILVALVFLAFSLLTVRIPPATIGVKQALWGSGGYDQQDYGTGLAWAVAGVHRWHFLPTQTQFIHFVEGAREIEGLMRPRESPLEFEDYESPVDVRTRDNNTVYVDVTMTYRILPGRGHTLVEAGYKTSYREQVRSRAKTLIREDLANLSSEEFQSTEIRLTQAGRTLDILKTELAQYYVEPLDVFIRAVHFPADYESKLQEKQYLNQKKLLDEALTQQATQQTDVEKFRKQTDKEVKIKTQDWEKRIQEKRSEYEVLIAQITAEANLYAQETKAQGDAEREIAVANGRLALDKAEALRDQLRNEALDTRGGRIKLALEAVENLNIPTVVLNSDDPAVPMLLDLDQMTRLLVGDPEEAKSEP